MLYEIAHRQRPSVTDLGREVGLDPGYLGRILRGLGKRGLVSKSPSPKDGRQSLLGLTARGRQTFATLDERQNQEVAVLLQALSPAQQARLADASALSKACCIPALNPGLRISCAPTSLAIWVGWCIAMACSMRRIRIDERFEALVAEIAAKFIQHFDPRRERCSIAKRDGEIVGSVFLVKKSKTVAKLRLLLVEPSARGLGIGKRLVGECVRFARQADYRKIVLWTQSELPAARHIYQEAGFRLMEEKPHRDWGRDDLVSEVWELTL